VSPHDGTVLAWAVGLLLLFAAGANALPARHAARVDPMTSLRAE